MMHPRRTELAEVRGLLADLVEEAEIQIDARLVGDGGDVEDRVGGAAQGHIHGDGVLEGGEGGDVPGFDVFLQELHDLHARLFGQAAPGGVDGQDRPIARQAEAEGLGYAVHGIGGVHSGAGAAAGTGAIFDGVQFLLGNLPGFDLSHALEDADEVDGLAFELARQHGAAADEDGGDVQAQGGHEHPGDDLVTVGDHHQGVEGVGHGHGFDGIGDEFPGSQRVFHPCVPHGDPVANPDGRKLHRRPAGEPNPRLDVVGDDPQVDVARDDFVGGVDDADDRPPDLFVRISHGLEQGAVGRPLQALLHQVAAHVSLLV